jgi:hypothetical protein
MPVSYLFDPNVCTTPCHDQLDTTIEKKPKENADNEDCSSLRGCLNCLELVNQTRSPPIKTLTFTILAVCSVTSCHELYAQTKLW